MKCLLNISGSNSPVINYRPERHHGHMGSPGFQGRLPKWEATYCGYINEVTVGTWAGGIVGLKSIMGMKRRQQALEMMDRLADLSYIGYTLDPKSKKLTYKITDWVVRCSGEPCTGREAFT